MLVNPTHYQFVGFLSEHVASISAIQVRERKLTVVFDLFVPPVAGPDKIGFVVQGALSLRRAGNDVVFVSAAFRHALAGIRTNALAGRPDALVF